MYIKYTHRHALYARIVTYDILFFPCGLNDLLNDFNGHKDDAFNGAEWSNTNSANTGRWATRREKRLRSADIVFE